ncbi:MAG: hypothetical protein MZW92_07695 [Comamonadaceae bacterium]|nr:hypothetical protein [Comamonadaceae bacterium]
MLELVDAAIPTRYTPDLLVWLGEAPGLIGSQARRQARQPQAGASDAGRDLSAAAPRPAAHADARQRCA